MQTVWIEREHRWAVTPHIRRVPVRVAAAGHYIDGQLEMPSEPEGVVVITPEPSHRRRGAHSRAFASQLHKAGLATLLVDLLTPAEHAIDLHTGELSHDIDLLSDRLDGATDWLACPSETRHLPVGYFATGACTAAALIAASRRLGDVGAIVSWDGSMHLVEPYSFTVSVPVLSIVQRKPLDDAWMHRPANARFMPAPVKTVRMTSRGLEEHEDAAEVARLGADWFRAHLLTRNAVFS